jgi:hypothetical protein
MDYQSSTCVKTDEPVANVYNLLLRKAYRIHSPNLAIATAIEMIMRGAEF